MPFCPECGKPVGARAKFCRSCGASLAEEIENTVPSAVTQPVPPAPAPAPVPSAVPAPPPPAPLLSVPSDSSSVTGGVRTCRACGNPIKPGDRYCSKCLVSVQDEGGSPVVPAPAPAAAGIPPVAPAPVPPAPAITPPETGKILTCRACGNPIKPGDRYCSKCLVSVQDEGGSPVVPAPAPAAAGVPPAPVVSATEPVIAPPPQEPGKYVCASCGNPLTGDEKFCNSCGSPAVAARVEDPKPDQAPSGNVCSSCGAQVSGNAKFCGQCGTKVG